MSVQSDIQGAYVAFFNRPADFLGLSYWTDQVNANGGSLAAVINAFSASQEYQDLYAGLSTAKIINTIYNNLFGRDAEPDGISYWGTRLDNGTFNIGTIAYSIFTGAQNVDMTTITNKVTVAVEFTNALDTSAEIQSYTTPDAADLARAYLSGVNSTTASVDTARANRDTTLAAIVNSNAGGDGNGGTTFAFTAAIDVLTGTGGDDIFVGDATAVAPATPFITAADSVNGGAGSDTLRYVGATGTPVMPQLTSVENIVFSAPSGALTFDGSTISGLASVGVADTAGGTASTFTAANNVALTVSKVGTADVAAAGAITLNTADAATAVAATVANGSNLTTLELGTVTGGSTSLKTINLTATGVGASTIATLSSDSTVEETLNISGTAGLTITNALEATVKTVNASTNTGGVEVTFAAVDAQALGGSGNDTFNFGGTLTSTDAVNGGAGFDTVSITGADVSVAGTEPLKALNLLQNVEAVKFTGATAAKIDGATFTNAAVTKLVFSTSTAAADDIVLEAGARTYAAGAGNDGDLTLTEKAGVTTIAIALEGNKAALGGAATIDALTVNLNPTDIAANPGTISTVNLSSTGVTPGLTNTIDSINLRNGSVVNVTGSQDLEIKALAEIVQAPAIVTPSLTVNASAFTGKLTVTGGTTRDVITGGTGNDVFNATAGGDTYTGGAGADTFVFTAAAQADKSNLTTITDFAVGTDKINVATYNGAPASTFNASTAKLDVSSAADFNGALTIAGNSAANSVVYFEFGGNTYVVFNEGAADGFTGSDGVVKLTGIQTLVTQDIVLA